MDETPRRHAGGSRGLYLASQRVTRRQQALALVDQELQSGGLPPPSSTDEAA